jgi:DNA-binding MarR family transcriptional regulator
MSPAKPHKDDDRQRLGHLLWEVSARTSLLAEAALAPTPLTPSSSGVLDTISEAPGTTIAEMARIWPTSAQNISQAVARLERLGFLERRLPDRGRGVALFITDAGERARADANARKYALDAELADALGADRYEQLVELLTEARKAFTALEAERRAAR